MQSEHVEVERSAFIDDVNAKLEYIVVALIPQTMKMQMRTLTLNECKIKHTISKSILILLLLLATTSIGNFASKPNSGIYEKPKPIEKTVTRP